MFRGPACSPHMVGADESEVSLCAEDLIEPKEVLRRTVDLWRQAHPASTWHRETAENILLLLDPSDFPHERHVTKPAQESLLSWPLRKPLCYAVFSCALCYHPPPASFTVDEPTSITLRIGQGVAAWVKDGCWVLVEGILAPSHNPSALSGLGFRF